MSSSWTLWSYTLNIGWRCLPLNVNCIPTPFLVYIHKITPWNCAKFDIVSMLSSFFLHKPLYIIVNSVDSFASLSLNHVVEYGSHISFLSQNLVILTTLHLTMMQHKLKQAQGLHSQMERRGVILLGMEIMKIKCSYGFKK